MSRVSPYTIDGALAPIFADENVKTTQAQLFHLITLELPDNQPALQLVDSNYDITYGGVTYLKFPIQFAGASISTDGTIDKASVAVGNVSRDIMYYVEKYDGLQNCRVAVKTVYANVLDFVYEPQMDGSITTTVNPTANSSAYLEDEFLIDNYFASEATIAFQLDPIIDLEVKLPRRRYMVDSCYWNFGDVYTCKYSGDAPLCNKTLAACRALNNEENFGGFPGISGSRRLAL